jgi:hypothetical protein
MSVVTVIVQLEIVNRKLLILEAAAYKNLGGEC